MIKKMGEDGACLFRAVADQLYGDEEMHQAVRTQCLDYIVSSHLKLYILPSRERLGLWGNILPILGIWHL